MAMFIKKLMVLFLVICFTCALFFACANTSLKNQTTGCDEKEVQYLANTYAKLHSNKSLNVAYIGGSVTDGYGATDQKKSWRGLSTEWLTNTFKEASITQIKASIGGTGSAFALFRMEIDLLSKNPDLIFIEFAINDAYNSYSYTDCTKFMESIIVKTYKTNPYADLIVVLVTDQYNGASDYDQLRAHKDVAKHYELPVIELNKKIIEKIEETGNNWSYYFKDGVHPNDTGYAYYNEVICEFLASELLYNKKPVALAAKFLPERLNTELFDEAYMILCPSVDLSTSEGWQLSLGDLSWLGSKYGRKITANISGSIFKTTFNGTAVGILYALGPDMGKISYSVDGASPKTLDAYQAYTNPKEHIIATNLSKEEHTLEIRLLSEKNSASTNTNFDIGAILVNGKK